VVDAPVDVARRYLDAFADADPDAISALVTDDFVNEHLAELGDGCVGRPEYRRRLPGFLGTFIGARYTVVTIGGLDLDGQVVARYRFTAHYDGTPIDIPGVMWFEVRDGLVARRTDLWDSLTFLRQTGQADRTSGARHAP
jgi:ketosteroid isomerase-like protein